MNKVLSLSLVVIFISSCSENADYKMSLTCTSYYDEEKIDDFNFYLQRDRSDLSFLEKSASVGIDKYFKENVEYCIKKDIPFQKHVYLFNKSEYDTFGMYDVSHSYSNCMLSKSEMMEKLESMQVTENFLIFGKSNALRFDKRKMTANKSYVLGDMDYGQYQYYCSLDRR
jgi:hypothetical protein